MQVDYYCSWQDDQRINAFHQGFIYIPSEQAILAGCLVIRVFGETNRARSFINEIDINSLKALLGH